MRIYPLSSIVVNTRKAEMNSNVASIYLGTAVDSRVTKT